jgi:hypothetical protein
MREVATPLDWVYAFLAYISVRSSEPLVRNMLTYARLIVREARRHGGSGWLQYDRVFRQQAAADPTLQCWMQASSRPRC